MRLLLPLLLPLLVAGSALAEPPWELTLSPGGEGVAGLTLLHEGGAAETYDLAIQVVSMRAAQAAPAPAISPILMPPTLALGPGERGAFDVRVQLPAGADPSVEWRLLVTAMPRSAASSAAIFVGEIAVRSAPASAAAIPAAPGQAPTIAIVAAGAAGIALLGVAFARREPWQWAALAAFAPLYSRLARSDVLAQPTRERVYDLVRADPGAHFALLAERAGLGSGALAHHLRILEKHALIKGRREGRLRRFYPAGEVPERADLTPHQARILALVESGGPTQGEIAAALGVTQQGASYHLRTLERKGRVELRFEGGAWRYFPVVRPETAPASALARVRP